ALPVPGADCSSPRSRGIRPTIAAPQLFDLVFTSNLPSAFVVAVGFDAEHLAFVGVEKLPGGAFDRLESASPDVAQRGLVLISGVTGTLDRASPVAAARLIFERRSPAPDGPMAGTVRSVAALRTLLGPNDVAVSLVPVH